MAKKESWIENIDLELDGKYYFPVKINKIEDSEYRGYVAESMDLQGVFTQGNDLNTVKERIREAVECALEGLKVKVVQKRKKKQQEIATFPV